VTNPSHTLFAGPVTTVFIDRDGVVNEKMPEGRYVTTWRDFHVLPGVVEAIGLLNQARLRVVVVSNQRGIALGLYSIEDVRAINAEFERMLEAAGMHVDGIYFCPHDKKECNCRKPLPGLFEQAAKDIPGISATSSVMMGDSVSDIEFGRRLGMKTIFIEGDPARQKPGSELARELADLSYSSLYEAVNGLLEMLRRRGLEEGSMCLGFPANPS
jgi:D-glycero-D-manno-heptose 1,7-bisphosphate phosphatase